ncbi:MAG: hypothetical protein PHS14_18635 [Elusimicrobia bacterium]|nr:hypothetical protein [Elusimicrobiota bacterium]
MKSVIGLGPTHVRHLVADASGLTLCKRNASPMYYVNRANESGYILCPTCDKEMTAIEAEAKKEKVGA